MEVEEFVAQLSNMFHNDDNDNNDDDYATIYNSPEK